MAYVIKHREVKIDSAGRVLLPKDQRDYFKSIGVEFVWFEQDTETNQIFLRWKRPKVKDHVTRASENFGGYEDE